MIGKLHEQSREPCILPLQLDKIKFTKHHQVFYIPVGGINLVHT